jgi:hypothetical protein
MFASPVMTMQARTFDAALSLARPGCFRVPSEWDRVSIPGRQRRRIGMAESGSIREGPPLESATIEGPPPAFDQVQQGSASGQGMEVEPLMPKVPQQALGAGVDGEVIDDHVDISCRNPYVHLLHQRDERGAIPALADME